MVVQTERSEQYRYICIVVFASFISSLIPAYHIVCRAICVRSNQKLNPVVSNAKTQNAEIHDEKSSSSSSLPNNKNNKSMYLTPNVRMSLIVSMLMSFIYLTVNCIQTIFMSIDMAERFP
eukprot:399875_1